MHVSFLPILIFTVHIYLSLAMAARADMAFVVWHASVNDPLWQL